MIVLDSEKRIIKPIVCQEFGEYCPDCNEQLLCVDASEVDVLIQDYCSNCDDVNQLIPDDVVLDF